MSRRSFRFEPEDPLPPTLAEQLAGTMFDAPAPCRHDAPDTSREAAEAVGHRVTLLRQRVLAAYREAGKDGLTPDECAARLSESVLAVRPRCTELVQWGHLRRTVARRRNASGCGAYVLVAAM